MGNNEKKELTLGIDIGSTTAKVVLIDNDRIVYSCYERHFSMVRQKTLEVVRRLQEYVGDAAIKVAISGSAGLGLARVAGIPFVQEVFATGETIKRMIPDAGTVIERGGEDAKILFFKGGID